MWSLPRQRRSGAISRVGETVERVPGDGIRKGSAFMYRVEKLEIHRIRRNTHRQRITLPSPVSARPTSKRLHRELWLELAGSHRCTRVFISRYHHRFHDKSRRLGIAIPHPVARQISSPAFTGPPVVPRIPIKQHPATTVGHSQTPSLALGGRHRQSLRVPVPPNRLFAWPLPAVGTRLPPPPVTLVAGITPQGADPSSHHSFGGERELKGTGGEG